MNETLVRSSLPSYPFPEKDDDDVNPAQKNLRFKHNQQSILQVCIKHREVILHLIWFFIVYCVHFPQRSIFEQLFFFKYCLMSWFILFDPVSNLRYDIVNCLVSYSYIARLENGWHQGDKERSSSTFCSFFLTLNKSKYCILAIYIYTA